MSKNKAMFNNQRFVTSGVNDTIPGYIQNILWYLIEIMDVPSKDYLQVLKLRAATQNGKEIQKIVHTQENPDYSKEHIISISNPLNDIEIFVIDDGTHTTMLLLDEY
jgi:hypothetical protein